MSRKKTKCLVLILTLSLLFSLILGFSDFAAADTRYEETEPSVIWTGTWTSYSNSAYSSGSTKYTNQTGATAAFSFSGTSITWIAAKAENRGKAKVYIDDVYQQDVDLYAAPGVTKQTVYTKSGLASGTHSIKVEVTGKKNASSSNTVVDVDAFETDGVAALPPPTDVRVTVDLGGGKLILNWTNPTDSRFRYVDIWRIDSRDSSVYVFRNVTGTSIVDSSLESGVKYSYKLQAVDADGNKSLFTREVSGTPLPAPPSNIKVENEGGGGKLIISWTNPPVGAYKFIRIYRSTSPGILGASITSQQLTGASFTDTGLANGVTYYYTLRAVDANNNESLNFDQYSGAPSVAKTYYEETVPEITFTGSSWTRYVHSGYSGGSTKYATVERDYATFTFSYHSIAWIAAQGNNRGIAKVYIDGVFQGEVDLYSPVGAYQQKVFIKTGMPDTTHTIKIEVSKDKNPASSGTVVDVDAFDLTGTAQAKGEGEIYGRVVDTGGRAIPGTAVRAGSVVVPTISTGEFRIPKLSPGIYIVYYDAPGYISQTQENIPVLLGKTTITPTVIMSPVPGAPTVAGAAFNGEIRGRVLNQAGQTIPGTAVRVNNIVVPTNPGGEFRFTLVAPGIYTVYYDAPGYIGQTQVIEVKPNAITTCPTAIMTPLGEIRGRVISADRRRAIRGTVVRINNTIMSTDRRGYFRFTLIHPGVYTVHYDAQGYKGQVQENIRVLPGVGTICPTVIMSR